MYTNLTADEDGIAVRYQYRVIPNHMCKNVLLFDHVHVRTLTHVLKHVSTTNVWRWWCVKIATDCTIRSQRLADTRKYLSLGKAACSISTMRNSTTTVICWTDPNHRVQLALVVLKAEQHRLFEPGTCTSHETDSWFRTGVLLFYLLFFYVHFIQYSVWLRWRLRLLNAHVAARHNYQSVVSVIAVSSLWTGEGTTGWKTTTHLRKRRGSNSMETGSR